MFTNASASSHVIITPRADDAMFESRLREYDRLFSTLDLVPLTNGNILDAGCGNGKWLRICCDRWGAQEKNCTGNDKRQDVWDRWFATNRKPRLRS